jgi:hypothetical protein
MRIFKKLFEIKSEVNSIIIDLKCNYTLINQIYDFDSFVQKNNFDLKKIKILTSLIWLNMSALHAYPLNE